MIVQESWLSIWNTMLMLCENGCLYISMFLHSYYVGWNYVTLKASMILLLNLWQRLCFNVVIRIQQNVTKFFILKNWNVFLTVMRAEKPNIIVLTDWRKDDNSLPGSQVVVFFAITSHGEINHYPSGLFCNDINSSQDS